MIKARIETQCNQDWNQMKIGLNSRFCDHCDKNVIDFTNKTKQEVLEYLISNFDSKTCGRIQRNKLDFSNTDYLVSIKKAIRQNSGNNRTLLLLTLTSLLLTNCTSIPDPTLKELVSNDTVYLQPIIASTPNLEYIKDKKESNTPKTNITDSEKDYTAIIEWLDGFEHDKTVIHGNICIAPTKNELPDFVNANMDNNSNWFVDQMPEFPGGANGFREYMINNVSSKSIDVSSLDVLFATFVIDTNGLVKNVSIRGTNSDQVEAIISKIIEQMPKWKPGKQKGKKVDVAFNLPITFI